MITRWDTTRRDTFTLSVEILNVVTPAEFTSESVLYLYKNKIAFKEASETSRKKEIYFKQLYIFMYKITDDIIGYYILGQQIKL
ncbi:hypothetical protein C922_05182 [Plasmodium inui San Antonio 1]|uniref:Uncharacterized protein n=1 Tax=Plasmodium inui San Antonio 1 TaxID=1237626 RepID=W6ZYL0_9APIC|nr:hypothetical protein C922_05182 [Plasmodium inui San Antonio 1]EUD64438.1 hypothetical protein C922_05182 [Plasmodium inui San Antonio 1]